MSGDSFCCHTWKVLLASNGQRPPMRLNTLQCPGPSPHNEELSSQTVNSGRNHVLEETSYPQGHSGRFRTGTHNSYTLSTVSPLYSQESAKF